MKFIEIEFKYLGLIQLNPKNLTYRFHMFLQEEVFMNRISHFWSEGEEKWIVNYKRSWSKKGEPRRLVAVFFYVWNAKTEFSISLG